MNTGTSRRTATIAAIISVLLLGGCLSDEESDPGFTGDGGDPINNAPTISGNPQSAVTIGNSYSFTPTASDPDGDALTFSVENLPVWASFETTTGRVSGQPTLADVGVFTGLRISVSDGIDSASLNAFSVTVSQVALGSATLSWTAPTQNTDGSPLIDLAGYKIYYGTATGTYQNAVQIDNPGIATYVVENLTPTTYYFVSTAFNFSGVESAFSNETTKVVN